MEQLNKEKLDVHYHAPGGPQTVRIIGKQNRELASRHQEYLDAKTYDIVINDLKSDIAQIGRNLPKLHLHASGSEVRHLYFGGLAYFGMGQTDIGLACFKLLYSLEDLSRRIAKPFDKMLLLAANQYRSFAQEHGVEYLNRLDVKEQFSKLKTGPCFIATAAYGTEFAPDVMILKSFRDGILLKSKFGKTIVEVYYSISPPVARVIEISEVLRKLTRNILVRPSAKVCRCRWSYPDSKS